MSNALASMVARAVATKTKAKPAQRVNTRSGEQVAQLVAVAREQGKRFKTIAAELGISIGYASQAYYEWDAKNGKQHAERLKVLRMAQRVPMLAELEAQNAELQSIIAAQAEQIASLRADQGRMGRLANIRAFGAPGEWSTVLLALRVSGDGRSLREVIDAVINGGA